MEIPAGKKRSNSMLRANSCRLAVLVWLLWPTSAGFAQVRSASIVGLVADPSGAPVPEAAVSVLSVDTNIKSETHTNVSGQYTVPYLTAGRYTVTVTKVGFSAS